MSLNQSPSPSSSPASASISASPSSSSSSSPFPSPSAPRFAPPIIRHQISPSPTVKITPPPLPSPTIRTPSPGPHLSTPPGPPVFSSPVKPPSNQPIQLHPQISDFHTPNVLFSAHKVLKQKKFGNVRSLGFGALVSPGRENFPGTKVIHRDPHRCQNCGAYANVYCEILLASGQWQCVICRNLNGSEGEYIASSKDELYNMAEFSSPLVDYVQTKDHGGGGFVPVSDSRASGPIVLVIDDCLDEPHLQHLQSCLHGFVDSLPPTARLGIVLYGRTISVYDFSEESAVSAEVISGDRSPSQDSIKQLIYGTGVYLSQIHASLPVVHSIISSLQPYKLNLPEASRDRCLGAAVEVALGLIRGPSVEMSRGVIKRPGGSSRIIVCAGGPVTYGPGSVPHYFSHPNYPYMEKTALKWMENLGHEAHGHNTVVDILCAGTCPVRVPVLQPLAKASGGVLILYDDFGEAFGANLQRASSRAAGSHGLLEIRSSDGILVTQVIGPGEEAPIDSHEVFTNDSAVTVKMLSVEETPCFAICLETEGDIKSNFVHFQFAIQYSNVYQADISRVITIKLPTVDSVSSYLEGVQDEVAAVLIAKRTLLRAKSSKDALGMRVTIDERLKDIANKFGSQTPKSKLYRFPKELPLLPELLFHLRRGPLLGSIVGHEDERSVLRHLFLNASFDLSIRMVAPRCLMHREGGTFEELPAYDLAMQSDAAVVLDHGTDIFIWLGLELSAQEGNSTAALAACWTLAEELSEARFPAPRILSFKEGSSQARYFVSRLIPAHRDPPYDQEARFPQLRTLTTEQRTKLKSSFLQFDDLSFCEWMRSLKVTPPEPR